MNMLKRILAVVIAIGLALSLILLVKEIIFLRHGLFDLKTLAMGVEVPVIGVILTKFALPEVITFLAFIIAVILPRFRPERAKALTQNAASLGEAVTWLLVGAGGSLAILLGFVKLL
jgi:hypothetical protein